MPFLFRFVAKVQTNQVGGKPASDLAWILKATGAHSGVGVRDIDTARLRRGVGTYPAHKMMVAKSRILPIDRALSPLAHPPAQQNRLSYQDLPSCSKSVSCT